MIVNEWFVSPLLLAISTVFVYFILCDTKCAHVSVCLSLCEWMCVYVHVHVYLQYATHVYMCEQIASCQAYFIFHIIHSIRTNAPESVYRLQQSEVTANLRIVNEKQKQKH